MTHQGRPRRGEGARPATLQEILLRRSEHEPSPSLRRFARQTIDRFRARSQRKRIPDVGQVPARHLFDDQSRDPVDVALFDYFSGLRRRILQRPPVPWIARILTERLQELSRDYDEIFIVAHSMGGLISMDALRSYIAQRDEEPGDVNSNWPHWGGCSWLDLSRGGEPSAVRTGGYPQKMQAGSRSISVRRSSTRCEGASGS
jgi:hypothetical protein